MSEHINKKNIDSVRGYAQDNRRLIRELQAEITNLKNQLATLQGTIVNQDSLVTSLVQKLNSI